MHFKPMPPALQDLYSSPDRVAALPLLSPPQAVLEGVGEVASFQRERQLPPLPLSHVSGLLQWGPDNRVKLPQKLPAACVSPAILPCVCCSCLETNGGHSALTVLCCAVLCCGHPGLAAPEQPHPAAQLCPGLLFRRVPPVSFFCRSSQCCKPC
jgi:hypothetical protein